MTIWAFDLRSSDSDAEDEDARSTSAAQIPPSNLIPSVSSPQRDAQESPQADHQTRLADELEELFGAAESEEHVKYKPNPWTIAKMNANARAAAGPSLGKREKPATKTSKFVVRHDRQFGWKNSCNKNNNGFFVRAKGGGERQGGVPHSPEGANHSSGSKTTPRSIPLRDSISAALRREMLATPTKSAPESNVGRHMFSPDKHGQSSTPGLACKRAHTPTPALDDTPPPNSDIRRSYIEHGRGAYIPSKFPTIPSANDIFGNNREYGNTHMANAFFNKSPIVSFPPVNNSCAQTPDDRLVSPSTKAGSMLTRNSREVFTVPPQHQRTSPNLASGTFFPYTSVEQADQTHYGLVPADFEVESKSRSDAKSGRFLNRASPGLSLRHSPNPSPTLQLVAKFAAPPPVLNEWATHEGTGLEERRANYDDHRKVLPISAWHPSSPASTPQLSSPYTEPKNGQKQNIIIQTPERRSPRDRNLEYSTTPTNPGSTAQWQPITPPNKAPRMMSIVSMERSGSEKPFWSTLPTPRSAGRPQPPREVKTTRFSLPGPFLGSSPLKPQGYSDDAKSLYKPPPRKRTRSPEPSAPRWKVTRIT